MSILSIELSEQGALRLHSVLAEEQEEGLCVRVSASPG